MERYIKSGGALAAPAPDAGATAEHPTAGNAGTGTPASVPGAYWYHMITEELRQLLTDAGLVPSSSDLTQVSKAVQALIEVKSGQYALDTGAADAYVIALNPVPAAYENGMTVRFKALNANTGPSTLDAGAGADALVNDQGAALQANDVLAGSIVTAVYDSASASWMITTMVPSQSKAIGTVIAYQAGAFSFPQSVKTTVTFDTVVEDTLNALNGAAGEITVPAGMGITRAVGLMAIAFGTQSGGTRQLYPQLNGANVIGGPSAATSGYADSFVGLTVPFGIKVAAGDVISFYGLQDSVSSLSSPANNNQIVCRFLRS